MAVDAYPLQWPEGQKRESYRDSSRFRTSFGSARDALMKEVSMMGGILPVLSTNIPLRRDGLPYADFRAPDDPGAAIYFQLKGRPMVFACDRWKTVTENVQALRMTVEALRGIERWGSSQMMERAFRGFTALPAPEDQHSRSWQEVLQLSGWASKEFSEVKKKRNELLRIYHPDFGSSPDVSKMAEVNNAFAQAEKELA